MPSSSPAPPSPRRAARTSGPGATASGPRSSTPADFAEIELPLLEDRAAIVPRRDEPRPVPLGPDADAATQELTWITGMRTMTTAGDVNIQVGMASHVYLVTRSMEDEYFFSADSELLIVPQEGRLRFCTELGVIDLEPKEIAHHPARPRLPRRGARGPVPRLRLRELRPEVRPAGPRPDRRQLPGQPARLQVPGRGLRGPRGALARRRQVVRHASTRPGSTTRRSTSSPGTATTAPTSTTCAPTRRSARSCSTTRTRRSSPC